MIVLTGLIQAYIGQTQKRDFSSDERSAKTISSSIEGNPPKKNRNPPGGFRLLKKNEHERRRRSKTKCETAAESGKPPAIASNSSYDGWHTKYSRQGNGQSAGARATGAAATAHPIAAHQRPGTDAQPRGRQRKRYYNRRREYLSFRPSHTAHSGAQRKRFDRTLPI